MTFSVGDKGVLCNCSDETLNGTIVTVVKPLGIYTLIPSMVQDCFVYGVEDSEGLRFAPGVHQLRRLDDHQFFSAEESSELNLAVR